MITALSIIDFVLIDRLQLEAEHGFTGLTGETGSGKSILLDAIGLALGMRPDKRFVRAGAERAVVAVTFELSAEHAVWDLISSAGLFADNEDGLILKRIVPRSGAARAFVNDQPVASGLLAEIGAELVEIHGQHAAADLLKPSHHRDLVDQFTGNGGLLEAHAAAWQALNAARAARRQVEAVIGDEDNLKDILVHNIGELRALDPRPGEAARLALSRQEAQQASRVRDGLRLMTGILEAADVDAALRQATAEAQRLAGLPAMAERQGGSGEGALGDAVRLLAEALDRTVIEFGEALGALSALGDVAVDDDAALEAAEARLFALKAAARKHRLDPDGLAAKLAALEDELAGLERSEHRLAEARAAETAAAARWRSAAETLSGARRAGAARLEKAVARELGPLKLGKAGFRVSVTPLAEDEADARGIDRIEIEVETNPGAGYGPLRRIASGGELARISLALKCAAATASSSLPALIFDEADQGVGGAVAHAIGERLVRLAGSRQVFAITHSPQVAAAAHAHWRIEKAGGRKGLGQTRAHVLNANERTEEIARMLSGAEVTREARAAAERLLER